MKALFRVITKTDAISVTKQDGTQILKATIVLQEVGGKYEDSFAATMLGNAATLLLYPGDVVWASLRFCSREYQGQQYQDVTLQDFIKVKS